MHARERERETVCVCACEREGDSVCVCVCERRRQCVCVCARTSAGLLSSRPLCDPTDSVHDKMFLQNMPNLHDILINQPEFHRMYTYVHLCLLHYDHVILYTHTHYLHVM